MAEDSLKYTSEDLKGMSIDELMGILEADQKELSKLKFSHKVTPLDNPRLIKTTRKNVARLKTELRARELANKQN